MRRVRIGDELQIERRIERIEDKKDGALTFSPSTRTTALAGAARRPQPAGESRAQPAAFDMTFPGAADAALRPRERGRSCAVRRRLGRPQPAASRRRVAAAPASSGRSCTAC
jgi:hypothetical protein